MGSLTHQKIVKIRKPHLCVVCGNFLPAGTQMQCETRSDDFIKTDYVCLSCVETESNKPVTINWDVPKELADKQFTGTPDEYLELKRAERRINNTI